MSAPSFIKRQFDLVVTLANLPANSAVTAMNSPQLPNDAPFVLKARAMRMQMRPAVGANPGQTLLNNVTWNYAGPDGEFFADDLVPFAKQANSWGQTPNGLWTQTPIVYPPGSVVAAYVQNNGGVDIPNLQLYYRGYQLFPCGSVDAPTYPGRISLNDWISITGPGTPKNHGDWTALTPLLQVTDTQRLLMVRAPGDSDFVVRAAQAISLTALTDGNVRPTEVFVQLYDRNLKAYSNDLVAADILFGVTPTYPATAAGMPALNGAQSGLFTPELYIPKNTFLYYDIQRADAYLTNTFGLQTAAESFVIGWKGSKVYTS